MTHGGYTYILFNKKNGTLYVGVSTDLEKRMQEHRQKLYPNSFTAKYNVDKLGYYELFDRIEDAIYREKQLKAGNRKKKIELIESMNPEWNDLYQDEDNSRRI